MERLSKDECRIAEELFAGWEETLIWSCLQGTMGEVWVDSRECPQSAQALTADFCFFAGEPKETVVRNRPDSFAGDFVIMVSQNEKWGELIEKVYGRRAKKLGSHLGGSHIAYEITGFVKKLFVMDEADYTDDMPMKEKYSVRAVIVKNGKIAAQKSRNGEYKILGGGLEEGESYEEALIREVQEEAGLVVKPESIRLIGETEEHREDIFEKGTRYACHSYFFQCDVTDETVETNMTESEIRDGYHLEWETPKVILRANRKFLDKPWIRRDTQIIKQLTESINES